MGSQVMQRLCIYCRRLEVVGQPCPQVSAGTQPEFQPSSTASLLIEQDEKLIASLQSKPSSLCARCVNYNIVGAFTESKPLDDVEILTLDKLGPDAQTARRQYYDSLRPFKLRLGYPSEIVLTPSCQLCRLLYWILPRRIEDAKLELHLEPYPAHIRESGWDTLSEYTKQHAAIFLGLASIESVLMSGISQPLNATSDHMMEGMMTGPAIGIEMPSPGRSAFNVQEYGSAVDLSLLRKSLDYCLENHGSFCQAEKPKDICEISVVDVCSRTVIPYPDTSEYVALSYVWGGVQPQKDALANGCLPQTIEDAIFVTKGLGFRYLWVDALCINQSPKTPEEIAFKHKQLGMMATIYGCAALTIVALTGKDSNAGIAGISVPRPTQCREVIHGRTFRTVPETSESSRATVDWPTRAWTLQEENLSLRLFSFGASEVSIRCLLSQASESIDPITNVKLPEETNQVLSAVYLVMRPQSSSDPNTPDPPELINGRMRLFDGMLHEYTKRRMTNTSDSLNAFLGMISAFERRLFKTKFLHGLPLSTHPASLAWMHDRKSALKRRPAFPSWCWSGWEGVVSFPEDVLHSFDNARQTTVGVDQEQRAVVGLHGQTHRFVEIDLEPNIESCNGDEITIAGWFVHLTIRTEPFSEVFVKGLEEPVAAVLERNFLHSNTLETGMYLCLVVQRHVPRDDGRGSPRQKVFVIVLEEKGEWVERRTMATVTMWGGHDFFVTKPEKRGMRIR